MTLVRLRCRGCGYGVSVREAPVSCPMCQGSEWEQERRRPLSTLTHDLLHLSHRAKAPTRPRV